MNRVGNGRKVDVKRSKEYYVQGLINKMVDLAQAVLEERVSVLVGACEIFDLGCGAGLSSELPFSDGSLRRISLDCDGIPISEDFRAKCSPHHLRESEPLIQQFTEASRENVMRNCREILSRYKQKHLEELEVELIMKETDAIDT